MGEGGIMSLSLNRVSNYVTHHAPCSVLIVRNDADSASYSVDPLYEEETETVEVK